MDNGRTQEWVRNRTQHRRVEPGPYDAMLTETEVGNEDGEKVDAE